MCGGGSGGDGSAHLRRPRLDRERFIIPTIPRVRAAVQRVAADKPARPADRPTCTQRASTPRRTVSRAAALARGTPRARRNSRPQRTPTCCRAGHCAAEPEPLATAAAAAARTERGAHRIRSPLYTRSALLKGSNSVMLLFDASLHRRQVSEGTHPPCARHSHKGVARLSGGGGGRTAAATCAEVRAEL
jgi:hypothetical protein